MIQFDRFDIMEAHYLYYRDYHTGQSSYKYIRLSKMKLKGFKPFQNLSFKTLTENGQEIYKQLVNNG